MHAQAYEVMSQRREYAGMKLLRSSKYWLFEARECLCSRDNACATEGSTWTIRSIAKPKSQDGGMLQGRAKWHRLVRPRHPLRPMRMTIEDSSWVGSHPCSSHRKHAHRVSGYVKSDRAARLERCPS